MPIKGSLRVWILFLGSRSVSLIKVFGVQRTCAGSVVTSASQLHSLRFCTIIEGNLTITVTNDQSVVDADYKMFDALEEITGVFFKEDEYFTNARLDICHICFMFLKIHSF